MDLDTHLRMVNHQPRSSFATSEDFGDKDSGRFLGGNHKQELPAKIPNLLLINADIINPMKVLFETAEKIVCKKDGEAKNTKVCPAEKDKKHRAYIKENGPPTKPLRNKAGPESEKSKHKHRSEKLPENNASKSPEKEKCQKIHRKHSEFCLKIDRSCLDHSQTADSLSASPVKRRKSECPPYIEKLDKTCSEDNRKPHKEAKTIERAKNLDKSDLQIEKYERIIKKRKDSNDELHLSQQNERNTNEDRKSPEVKRNHQGKLKAEHTGTNICLDVTNYNRCRRKSETPTYWNRENQTPGDTSECRKKSHERSENVENTADIFDSHGKDRQPKGSDEFLMGKTSRNQKIEKSKNPIKDSKNVKRSQNSNKSETSPIDSSLNIGQQISSSSSLLIPDLRMSRRKSETPSYKIQADAPSLMPFQRRQSEAPPALLLRASPTHQTEKEDEDDDEASKRQSVPSLVFVEPETSNSISDSLTRLAIGK